MVATTRSVFDRQLSTLQDSILHLSELVNDQLLDAVKALSEHDIALAQRVDASDKMINRLRYDIEERSYTMLALQQPNSRDMRKIVASVSLATNLERMGDHAAGIARLVIRMENTACRVQVNEFDEMAQKATSNLLDAMTALATEDKILARATVSRDAEIDQMHKHVYDRLITMMTANPEIIECATMMLWVSHNLERYADRNSNICERVIYLITGELHEIRADQMP